MEFLISLICGGAHWLYGRGQVMMAAFHNLPDTHPTRNFVVLPSGHAIADDIAATLTACCFTLKIFSIDHSAFTVAIPSYCPKECISPEVSHDGQV